MKAIITADNHLNKYYSKMRPNQLEKRRRQLEERFGAVVDYAIEEDADLFLHCGDLFDMPNPRNPPISFVAKKLVELEKNGIKTFLVVGNHDKPKMTTGAGGSSPQRIYDAFDVSRIFSDHNEIQKEEVELEDTDVTVAGISHNPLLEGGDDPLEGKKVGRGTDLTILLAHYGVEGHLAGRTNEPAISHASIDSVGADVVCSGHIHKPKDFEVGQQNIIVPGATERMAFGELEHDTGFYVMNYDGEDVETEYVDLEPQPMTEKTISSNDLKGDSPTQEVLSIVEDQSDPEQLFKLRFEGILSREQYHRLDNHKIWQQGRDLNFYFDLVDDLEFEVQDQIELGGERLSQVEELKRVAGNIEEGAGEDSDVVREARDVVLSDYGGEGTSD